MKWQEPVGFHAAVPVLCCAVSPVPSCCHTVGAAAASPLPRESCCHKTATPRCCPSRCAAVITLINCVLLPGCHLTTIPAAGDHCCSAVMDMQLLNTAMFYSHAASIVGLSCYSAVQGWQNAPFHSMTLLYHLAIPTLSCYQAKIIWNILPTLTFLATFPLCCIITHASLANYTRESLHCCHTALSHCHCRATSKHCCLTTTCIW